MERVLVAGAGGRLGTAIMAELKRRGYRTRALVRDEEWLHRSTSYDEVVVGDARRPETLRGACDGASVVISAMGASLKLSRTTDGATYREVDYLGNLTLLAEAKKARVRKFIYVSLYGAERLRGLGYVDAHEEFVEALQSSGLNYTVVRPTGFFYVFEELFKMAQRGRVVIVGAGGAKTNPVHEADVARECVDAVECGDREVAVGGPETYTRREIAEMAFGILSRRPRIVSVPAWLLRAAAQPLRLIDRRLFDLLAFGIAVSDTDVLAPPAGTTSLRRHFRQLAGLSSGINPRMTTSSPDLGGRAAHPR